MSLSDELALDYLTHELAIRSNLTREGRLSELRSERAASWQTVRDALVDNSDQTRDLVLALVQQAPTELLPTLGEGILEDWLVLHNLEEAEWLVEEAVRNPRLELALRSVTLDLNSINEPARSLLRKVVRG